MSSQASSQFFSHVGSGVVVLVVEVVDCLEEEEWRTDDRGATQRGHESDDWK